MAIRLFALALVAAFASAASDAQAVRPERIFEALGVGEGSTVCEIGAGDGALSIAAAKVVGPTGRVYSSELGEARVNTLREKTAASDLEQIVVVAGESGRTNFPDAQCEGVVMRDVYHHFTEPAAMNASIARSLSRGGRVAIIDFTPPPESEAENPADRGKDGMHGITPETLLHEVRQHGYESTTLERGDRWFFVVLVKRTP